MIRVLPPEEWYKLPDEIQAFCGTLNPEDVKPVVFEKDGEIVGRVLMLRAPHLEAWWVAPEHYGNAGVTRGLLRTALGLGHGWGWPWVFANADPGQMTITLERLGGRQIPVQTFMVPSELTFVEEACPTECMEGQPTLPSLSDPTMGISQDSNTEPTLRAEEAVCHQQ